jgi:MoaA/NifB/PqqE/SkfB family radical SAM enzyme
LAITWTKRLGRNIRIARKVAWGLLDRNHPILVHLIAMRRCNLACAYCNEYDAVSKPVPAEIVRRRIDRLSELGAAMLTFSGGEPLMHPEIDGLVAHARGRGMIVTLITNGFFLSLDLIQRLNRAGLDHVQVSIDNVEPDEASKKSLRLLEPKLRWLAEGADFSVSINSVLGSGVRNPQDALAVARRARALGFNSSLGIVHDGRGQLRPLSPPEMEVYEELKKRGKRGLMRFNHRFQDNLVRGRPNDWSCRAGSRYLYIDEHGLVHYCSQQRGIPAVPLESYGLEDIRREYHTKKGCAPYCTVNCVQQVALLDNWRSRQVLTASPSSAARRGPATAPVSDGTALVG